MKQNSQNQTRPNYGQNRVQKPQNNQTQHQSQNRAPKIQIATNTRRGEVMRAKRMLSSDVSMRASQHIIDTPVNKSIFNGNKGDQITPTMIKKMRSNPNSVRIIPIGGLGEVGIGKNMTLIEYKDEMILIDMGTIFPSSNDYPGINYMTQDMTYVMQNIHKLKAILFTHAHLDHIGGVKNILPTLPNVPIFGTAFTIGMIQRQMEELEEEYAGNYQIVDPELHENIALTNNLSFEFVHVLHSIPGAVAIVLRTPNGIIVHSGDWRFEKDPVGRPFDMPRLLEISQKEGIDLLMNESTNIDSPGTHPTTEKEIGDNIGKVMDEFPNSRIILSCFSSQIYRIQEIMEEAKEHGRKVAFSGYSMINNVETALRAKEIKIPKDTVVKIEDIVKLPDSKVTIICTGSQGELNAVLNRMVTGAHRFIKIKGSDVILFSSNPIPGNEPMVVNTIDGLLREGASVIQNGRSHLHGVGLIHLSGHAYYEDHVLYVKTLNPRNYMPIHGQFFMLQHNAEMANKVIGIDKERIIVSDDGDVIELTPERTIRKAGRIKVGSVMYDAADNQVHEAVVKDRLHISTQGIVIVVLMISKKTGRLAKTPDIISRAFIYLNENEELMSRIRHYLKVKSDQAKITTSDEGLKQFKDEVKDDIAHILYDTTKKTPIVIPVVNLF